MAQRRYVNTSPKPKQKIKLQAPQGNAGRRAPDMSPEAQRVRGLHRASQQAREALDTLGGHSPVSTAKLRRESQKADQAAFEAAMEYRKSRQRKS